jgi:hypothetical protein
LINAIQTPSLSLSKDEMDLGLYIFDQSLVALRSHFPKSKIGVAYLPSVITPYDVTSAEIHDYYADKHHQDSHIQPSHLIEERSNYICARVREIATRRVAGFIDSRARLRSVAKNNPVHGPLDWNHFNRLGYETLSVDLIKLTENMTENRDDGSKNAFPECQWEYDKHTTQ